MAEGGVKSENSSLFDPNSSLECAICLQSCVHPAELPCGHIFCFLCIKGIAFQSGRCAMCREPIPIDFLFKPRLVTPLELDGSEDIYNWYYEGYSGWWQYDQRASAEIEEAYQKGEKSCQLLLAGSIYTIDFITMVQYRQTNAVRRRRIKRDRATTDKLGVAGLRPGSETETGDINVAQAAQATQALVRRLEEVHMGLHRLWQQTSDEIDIRQRHSSDVQQTDSVLVTPNFQTGPVDTRLNMQRPLGSEEYPPELAFSSNSSNSGDDRISRFVVPRHDLDQGLESIGPDEYPLEFNFRLISPNSRDGRTFNPRLELEDGGDDDSEETDDDEAEDGPTRMFSGPCNVSSAAFRPMPMRVPMQETADHDREPGSSD